MAEDTKRTQTDGNPDVGKKPINKPKVEVELDPHRDTKGKPVKVPPEYTDKVKRHLEGEVRDAIKKGERDGSDKQLENAGGAVKQAADQIDPSKVKKVRVTVTGDIEGTPVKRTIVEPTKQG